MFSLYVAAPSIIIWGLGIPFLAYLLLRDVRTSLNSSQTREKFGFLYRGYTTKYYFWEIVIMYRKIFLIFVSVFISSSGALAQAMIVLVVLVL
jgi:hypothetical protein